jgi:hypothetical protein
VQGDPGAGWTRAPGCPAADSRQQTADSRQQTAGSRQQAADSRQQTAMEHSGPMDLQHNEMLALEVVFFHSLPTVANERGCRKHETKLMCEFFSLSS